MPIERGLGADVVVEDSNEVWKDSEGTLRRGVNIATSAEKLEEYRQGYRCLRCHGVQDEPFPEVCKARDTKGGSWRCGYQMRSDQTRDFGNEHRGEFRFGPSPLDFDYEQEDWKPRGGSRIWLPHGINDKE